MGDCSVCGQSTLHQYRRLIQDTCGHLKCRLCLIQEENGCSICICKTFQSQQTIQSIDYSLPNGFSENLNPLYKIILTSSQSQEEILMINKINNFNIEDNQVKEINKENVMVINFNNTTVINCKNYNCPPTASNQIIENNNSIGNEINVENENQNCNLIVESPRQSKSYRSPEFNMSDYLLFKNPYSFCPSPEFRLSDYIIIKSPTRIANIEQPYNSPIQNYNEFSSSTTNSNCLMFSEKSRTSNNSGETYQTICYMLNNYDELIHLSNYIVTEFLDSSSGSKKLMINYTLENETNHMIQDITDFNLRVKSNNKTETCIIQEVDDSLNHESNHIVNKKKKVPITKRSKNVKTHRESCTSDKIKPLKKRKIKNDLEKPERKKRRKANRDWSHIEMISNNPRQYTCTVCQKVFKCLQSKVYHSACKLGIEPFKCTFKDCGRTFNIRSNFDYHQKVHSGEKPFQCDDCKKNFIDKNRLIRHIINVHNKFEVKCNDCEKKFRSKEYLKQHVVIHQGKSYKCEFCNKVFSLDGNRRRHELSHSSERPHKCDVCSATFKSKFLLTRHKRIHGNDKPYSCKHCHQVFLSKSEVQRHILSHFDEKPFSCKKCNLKFRRKDNLKRHIKHHHPEDDLNKLVVVNDNTLKKDKSMANNAIEKLSSPKSKFTSNIISRQNSFFKVRSLHKTRLFGSFDDWDSKIKPFNTEVIIEELPLPSNKTKENQSTDTISTIDEKIKKRYRNEGSNDVINFISKQERSKTEYTSKKKNNEAQNEMKNNSHKHWRRRITESLISLNS